MARRESLSCIPIWITQLTMKNNNLLWHKYNISHYLNLNIYTNLIWMMKEIQLIN